MADHATTSAEVKYFEGIPKDSSISCPPGASSAILVLPDDATIEIGKSSQVIPNRNALVVGRQVSSCDIRITHKSLSRQHALLYYHAGRLYVLDLKTKTGTLVNHQKVISETPIQLNDGDVIQFGKAKPALTVRWDFGKGSKPKESENTINTAETIDGGNNKNDTNNHEEDPAIANLTGREKRKAEIAAMMASLDQAPTYTKFVPTTDPAQQQSQASNNTQEQPTKAKKKSKAMEKYQLPFTDSTDLAVMESSNTSSAVMDPTGARFAIGSTDSSLKLYDFAGFNELDPTPFRNLIVEDGYPIRSMVYSSDGSSILIGTGSAQPRVFSRDGQEIVQFVRGDVYVRDPSKTVGHTAAVTSVGWHPLEKSTVFSTSRDGSLRSWNVDKGKLTFGKLNCSDVVVIKHLRNGRKTIPTCLAVSTNTFAIGTECGSLQIYQYPLVSKLRPQQSVQVSSTEDESPIISLVYSLDARKIAVRTKKEVTIWNTASRISSSTLPLAKYENLPLHDDGVGADGSTPTMAFSPDGKTICVATNSKGNSRTYQSSLQIFVLPKPSKPKNSNKAVVSIPILNKDGALGPILSLSWHHKLNQVLVTLQKGFQVFYSVDWSTKGILLTSGRRKKRKNKEDSLQELYAARAPPPGSAIRQNQIITPNALPLFSGDKQRSKSKKQRMEEEHQDSVAKHIPQKPSKGVFATGVNAFTQMIMDSQEGKKMQIAGMDPREALAKYSEGKSFIGTAYEGNVERILTEKTMEEEQEERNGK